MAFDESRLKPQNQALFRDGDGDGDGDDTELYSEIVMILSYTQTSDAS